MSEIEEIEDYLDTMRGLASGIETEVDPQRVGDVQAFRDFAAEQADRGVVIEIPDEED